MNYSKIYNQIIERAKMRQLLGYKEKHHIIPKCIGGSNDKENLVDLTAKEHFICHILLCEIYPNENKLKHALFLMSIGKQLKEKYYISSRTYERIKKEYSQFLTGQVQSEETKKKKSNSMLQVWKNKSKKEKSEIGLKRWKTRKINGTDKITKIHATNISKALKGRNPVDNGKRIIQMDLNGNYIREYKSAKEADKMMGGKGQNTADCARGRQNTAYGFKWKWK